MKVEGVSGRKRGHEALYIFSFSANFFPASEENLAQQKPSKDGTNEDIDDVLSV